MNYLEIVKETARLSGTVDPRSVATVETGGRIRLIAALVAAAWQEIQSSQQAWRFRVIEFPEVTGLTPNVNRYTAETLNLTNPPWSNWILGGAGSIPLTIWAQTREGGTPIPADELRRDEQALTVLDYPAFRASYQTGASIAITGRPQAVAVNTQDELVVWPTPTETYRLSGTYRRAPQILTEDDDTPIVAEEFHRLIAWAGKLLLDHYDEADGNVLLADMNLPMTFEASLASLRRRYLSGGVSIARVPVGGSTFRPVPSFSIPPSTVGF